MTMVGRITSAVGAVLALLLVAAALGVAEIVKGLDWTANWMMIALVAVVLAAIAVCGAAARQISRTMGRQLHSVAGGIGTSAGQLLVVASQVAAATAETAAATNQTTATLEEVKQTALLAQEKTGEASELSQHLAEGCKHGEMSARQNFGMFERIQGDMQVVSDAIDRLNEQAQSVGDIIATVNDLAEQSNLLSVNASIEAAKAGEYGKGFTVVAQEVKNLAEQSKQAVTQVRAMLSEIQKASAVAVRSAEQSQEAVEAGRLEANVGIENTKREVAAASQTAEATMQISATSRQQLAGIEQISQAIQSINVASGQSASSMRLVEHEARQLQELAVRLQSLIDPRGGKPSSPTAAHTSSV